MQKVLTAAEMREVDRLTTERYGIPSIILMENAAHAVARVITERLGGTVKDKRILILCGKGNNGGDGAALARILWQQEALVSAVLFGKVNETNGDARSNFEVLTSYRQAGSFQMDISLHLDEGSVGLYECEDGEYFRKRYRPHKDPEIVVDALLGTGVDRPIERNLSQVLSSEWLDEKFFRERRFDIVSVDLPSGLSADHPTPIGSHVTADLTVTFTAPKIANLLGEAGAANGELIVANIGTPQYLVNEQPSKLYLTEKDDVMAWVYRTGFATNSYKNKRGHCLIVAGSADFSGAAVLAGNAAMRSGLGLVTLATSKSSRDSVASRTEPEIMVRGVAETENGAVAEEAFDELTELFAKANAIAIGSGLSQSESTKRFVEQIIEHRKQPVVIDADALNLLSPWITENHPDAEASPLLGKEGSFRKQNHPDAEASPLLGKEGSFRKQNHPDAEASPLLGKDGSFRKQNHPDANERMLILTPHEGEFLRLLGETENHPDAEASPLLGKEGNQIKDRVAAVREFSQKHNVILVLKGERVLIGEPGGKVVVNPTGNSGLGKAGNGDTLTGIIAGFVTQASAMDIDIFETVVAAVYVAGMAGDIAEKKYGKRVMTASDVRECLADAFANLNFSNS